MSANRIRTSASAAGRAVKGRWGVVLALVAALISGAVPVSPVAAQVAPTVVTVVVREDRTLRGETVRAVSRAARTNGVQAGVIHQMVLHQVGVKRGATYDRYGAILPVGVETWPVTWARQRGIDAVLLQNRAVVERQSAARWNVAVGDALVLVGWHGEVVDVVIGALADATTLENAEIVLLDEYASTKQWRYPDRVVVWGEQARLTAAMAAALMPIGTRPDARFARVRVEASWGTKDPDVPQKLLELKTQVGEFRYVRVGKGVMRIDAAWMQRLTSFSAGGVQMRCAPSAVPRVQAGFAQMQAAGLMDVLDVRSTQRHGGCQRSIEAPAEYYLRTGRPHVRAWGTAVDLRLKLVGRGCDVIRAWRRAGWAWVGTGPNSVLLQYSGRPQAAFPSPRCP